MGNEILGDIEQVYMANYDMMYAFAMAVLRDSYQSEDAVQEAFLEALRKYDTFKDHPNQAGWLMLTLKRKIQEQQRRNRRHLSGTVPLEAQELRDAGNELDMDMQLILKEFNLPAIQRALSQEEYYLLTRFALDEASYATISKEMGVSPAACAKRIERIRKKLRDTFPQLFEDS